MKQIPFFVAGDMIRIQGEHDVMLQLLLLFRNMGFKT